MNTLLRLTEFKNRLVRDWNLMPRESAALLSLLFLTVFLAVLGIDNVIWGLVIVAALGLYVDYRANKVVAKYDRMDFELNEMLRDK